MAVTARDNLKVLGFLIATVFFFGSTLLGTLFAVTVFINQSHVPHEDGPTYLMMGLVPPSVATFFFYTKVLGRFL